MDNPPPYSDILSRHEQFVSVCDAVGLSDEARAGRFGRYVERIHYLNSQIERIHRGEPEDRVLPQLVPDLPHYLIALTETREVGTMVPFLRTCPPEALTRRLKAILAGPDLPLEEDHASNQARNIQFELSLATMLSTVASDLGSDPYPSGCAQRRWRTPSRIREWSRRWREDRV